MSIDIMACLARLDKFIGRAYDPTTLESLIAYAGTLGCTHVVLFGVWPNRVNVSGKVLLNDVKPLLEQNTPTAYFAHLG